MGLDGWISVPSMCRIGWSANYTNWIRVLFKLYKFYFSELTNYKKTGWSHQGALGFNQVHVGVGFGCGDARKERSLYVGKVIIFILNKKIKTITKLNKKTFIF